MQNVFLGTAVTGVLAVLAVTPAMAANDDAVANFYGKRTVTVLIGAGMGGSYGLYGQLTSNNLGRHVPGTPNMVIQSMPGAGGMKALNYAYNVSPRDGSVILGTHQEVLQETVLNPKAKFDVRKFRWLGRYTDVDYVGFVTGKSGVKNLDDARKRQIVVGATGARAANALGSLAFNRFAGTKFKVITGYKSTSEMFVAAERGEIDSVTATWVVMKAFHLPKIRSGQLVPIFAMALNRLKEYPNVPAITEFGANAAEKKFLNFWASGGMIGRSAFTSPGIPEDRLNALRVAFDTMVVSPDFLATAKKRKASLNPMGGKELEVRIAKVMDNMTNADRADARRIYGELLASARKAPKRKK
ncbi:MAG: tripartite tricarboxylate transporter substrate-binding protein [Proteobacteria bacterium]|nr:tripartite tricarboxylate transporter substrate-binding protein [Pseudomonadota bacterium]